MNHPLNVAFIFPGHGSQFVGMGKDVYESFPEARNVFDVADATLGFSISKLCFEGPEEELCQPFNVQPALVAFSMAMLAVMRRSPTYAHPSYAAGHSLGEYAALAASGMIGVSDAIMLARQRGQLMYNAGLQKPGIAVTIIGLEDEVVIAIAKEAGVYVANYNYPGQVVISGAPDHIKKAIGLANAHGARKIVPIAGSVAFHSPFMQPAAEGLAQAIAKIRFHDPLFHVIGNASASPITLKVLSDELTQQICQPVLWKQSIFYLLSQDTDLFVEIGPGNVLSNIMKRIDEHVHTTNIKDSYTLSNYLCKGFAS